MGSCGRGWSTLLGARSAWRSSTPSATAFASTSLLSQRQTPQATPPSRLARRRSIAGGSNSAMPKQYTVSDGKLVLVLRPAGKGWYAVTSPLDPGLITQARSVEEAFVMAYDAQ